MITLTRLPTVGSLNRMHREVNDLFNAVFAGHPTAGANGLSPAMNVWEDDMAWRIEAELPGYRMDDIDVTVHNNQVTIKGKRQIAAPEGATHLRRERRSGSFERTWTLPGDIAADNVEASLNHGVLLLTLPKSPKSLPRKIAVKTS